MDKDRPTIEIKKHGPYKVSGIKNLKNSAGKTLNSNEVMYLCKCGSSKNMPYCDGTHLKIGLSDEKEPDQEFIQNPDNQDFIEPALRCILCASCTAACPINRANEEYLGPSALLRSFRYIFDSRDTITDSRLDQVNNDDGVWGCKTMWLCTEVCPKGIPVTKCLGQIKRLIKEKENVKRRGHSA